MNGVAVEVDLRGFDALQARLSSIGNPDLDKLLKAIGADVEKQTRRRIQVEKTDPEGKPWVEWSPKYEKTRHGNQSKLQSEGALVGTLQWATSVDAVEFGSNLPYAARQQYGDAALDLAEPGHGIPARAYLGLNEDGKAELLATIDRWFATRLGDA